jgi:Flp pilus assembly protein TadG
MDRGEVSLGRGRCTGDCGTVLAEVALTIPIFLVVIFASFEFGFYFRDSSTVADAVSSGARWASIQGPDLRWIPDPSDPDESVGVTADYSVLAAIREELASLPKESVEQIVIYRANSPRWGDAMSQLPAACKTATNSLPANGCNVYPGNDAFLAVQTGDTDYFVCDAGVGRACGWPPSSRDDGPDPDEIDYAGVYVRYQRGNLTGLFSFGETIESAKVLRLEPGQVE